nr:Nucleobase-ascorbate transporter 6 [Ipomoea batatas]
MIRKRRQAVIGGSYTFVPCPRFSIILAAEHIETLQIHRRKFEKDNEEQFQGAVISGLSTLQIILRLQWPVAAMFISPLFLLPLVALSGFGLFAKCVKLGLPLLHCSCNLFTETSIFLAGVLCYSLLLIVVGICLHLLNCGGKHTGNAPHEDSIEVQNGIGVADRLCCSIDKYSYPFQWVQPTLMLRNHLQWMATSFVALVEVLDKHLGILNSFPLVPFYAGVIDYAYATPIPPSVLAERDWTGSAVAILLSGLFGTGKIGSSVSVLRSFVP